MSKLLLTFGTGKCSELLEISRPLLQAYALQHGYDFCEDRPEPIERPPSWYKLPFMQKFLRLYDEVLWVDCDVIVVDGSEDLADLMPADAWQGMMVHHEHLGFRMGPVPSCGVWLVRPPMLQVLQQAWEMTQWIHHPWWEQAALHELLGYEHNGKAIFPVREGPETELRRHTHWLPEEYNSIDIKNRASQPRFMHMAGLPHAEKLEDMRYWAGCSNVT